MHSRLGILLLCCFAIPGCERTSPAARRQLEAARDSGFVGVQTRGERAMGVDQYTSTHVFTPTADGGRIELQRDADDSAGSATIRRHMRVIAGRFAAGDFQAPGFVHGRRVPGTEVLASKKGRIRYTVESLPRGAALRVRSDDPGAVAAIHEFLAFQRRDHHAGSTLDSIADSITALVAE